MVKLNELCLESMPAARLTKIAPPPPKGPRSRTYRLLLDQAMEVAKSGHVPSVAQVASEAGVSRATAYRYFPTRSKLVAAMVNHSLGPVRSWRGKSDDGRTRVNDLFDQTFPRFKEYEPQLRAALMIAVEHQLRERADTDAAGAGQECAIARQRHTHGSLAIGGRDIFADAPFKRLSNEAARLRCSPSLSRY